MLNCGLAFSKVRFGWPWLPLALIRQSGTFMGGMAVSTLALDIMEPKRPQLDRAVLEFAKAHTFSAGDITLLDGGVCWLNPQVAGNIVALVSKQIKASRATDALLSFII